MIEFGDWLMVNLDIVGCYYFDWFSMMYFCLKLVRNFLVDDGLVFISIDFYEVYNFIRICDEIFGLGSYKNMIVVCCGIKNV